MQYLTGHIDLLFLLDNTLIVADYKPSLLTKQSGKLVKKFFHSLPQICLYGLLLKDLFDINDIKCITFNQHKAWVYDPAQILKEIRKVCDVYNIDAPWNDYVNF